MKAFWGDSIFMLPQHSALTDAHHTPLWVGLLPLVMGLAGIALAYWMYVLRPGMAPWLAARLAPLYQLSFHKWWFDELYDRIFVRPAFYIGRGLWKSGDGAVIDRSEEHTSELQALMRNS